MRVRALSSLAISFVFSGLLGSGAVLADEAGLGLELNKLETAGGNCRATLVVENREPRALGSLKVDLVMFDPGGVVSKRVAVELGPLPRKKTSVRLFEIADLRCDQIGRVLLNDVAACADESGARADCLDGLAVSSRASAPLAK